MNDDTESDETLAALKKTHGEGHVAGVLTVKGWAFFRTPTVQEIGRWRKLTYDDKTRADALGILARAVVLSPATAEFGAWCDEFPLIPEECGETLLSLAGVTGKAQVKK